MHKNCRKTYKREVDQRSLFQGNWRDFVVRERKQINKSHQNFNKIWYEKPLKNVLPFNDSISQKLAAAMKSKVFTKMYRFLLGVLQLKMRSACMPESHA